MPAICTAGHGQQGLIKIGLRHEQYSARHPLGKTRDENGLSEEKSLGAATIR